MRIWKKMFGGDSTLTPAAPVAPQSSLPAHKAAQAPAQQPGQRLTVPTSGSADLNGKLISAICHRSVDEVRRLLAAGASAKASKKRSNALYWEGEDPAIHFALAQWHEADHNEEDACIPILDLLLKFGADIDEGGSDGFGSKRGYFTPLMNAVQHDRPKTVEWLIERGANTSIRTLDGLTAFELCRGAERTSKEAHWSVQRILAERTEDGKAWAKSPEGQSWLRDREADPAAPLGVSPEGAWSDLGRALSKSSKEQNDEIIKWVESGGNVSWSCAEGLTLLHYAAQQDNEKMVRFLLNHGSNVNAVAKFGMTPLLVACKEFSFSVIPILLDHGADPSAQTESGRTALQFIRQSGLAEAKKMADLLLSQGVRTTPGKDSTCQECGAPETMEMRRRGVQVTLNGVFATFACPGCNEEREVEIGLIDKAKGVDALCSCGAIAHIPAAAWCMTCGNGLSTGWQAMLIKKR